MLDAPDCSPIKLNFIKTSASNRNKIKILLQQQNNCKNWPPRSTADQTIEHITRETSISRPFDKLVKQTTSTRGPLNWRRPPYRCRHCILVAGWLEVADIDCYRGRLDVLLDVAGCRPTLHCASTILLVKSGWRAPSSSQSQFRLIVKSKFAGKAL